MEAMLSGTDNQDEKATLLYTVIGRLDIENPEIKVKASNGGYFIDLIPEAEIEINWGEAQYPKRWRRNVKIN